MVNYLDLGVVLNNYPYKTYRKPNDKTFHVQAKSNSPPNIIRQLSISAKSRLSYLSCNPKILNQTAKHCQNILNQSRTLNWNNNTSRNRRINSSLFNHLLSKKLATNNEKSFLQLIKKHFPINNKVSKLFNKKNLTISYSCMPNINSITNTRNKKIFSTAKPQTRSCSCINKSDCPLINDCHITNTIYQAKLQRLF